jgi:uncharacterized protein YlzI (FlbEa/FlbD family)
MFIKLNRPNQQPIYLNADHILGFQSLPESTALRLDKTVVTLAQPMAGVDIVYVNESVDEIMTLLSD